ARHALLLKDDHLLLKWKEEISEMCRFCPNKNCNMLIERTIEGCNHMECTNCKTHFCWICESFKSDNSRDIYRHMLEIHGSYGVDYAHLNMGNYWEPFDYYEDVEQPLPIMTKCLSRKLLYGQLRTITFQQTNLMPPSKENQNKKSSKDEEKQQNLISVKQKEAINKKKNSDKTSTSAAINFDNFGRGKRRNSLTDSPLTGLSPSSGASNGDSADDIGG
uniref:RBR-type E3 ubiquitin transferase n=1 Tax=Meloidogyne javanica TaxID=6303 RepID=A0A915NDA0_MELJA